MEITGLLIGFVAGGIIAWIMATLLVRSRTVSKQELEAVNEKNVSLHTDLIVAQEKLKSMQEDEAELKTEITAYREKTDQFRDEIQILERNLSGTTAQLNVAHDTVQKQLEEIGTYKLELKSMTDEFNETNRLLAASTADFNALKEKLETQKAEHTGTGFLGPYRPGTSYPQGHRPG